MGWRVTGERDSLKNIELKLISELMIDCSRSDGELARILHVCQPTVSRVKKKLEREGYIRGYSAIPDFSKIGFDILAITFAKFKGPVAAEELEKARDGVRQWLNRESSPAILGMSGFGVNADRVIITLHEKYSDYDDFTRFIENQPLVAVEGVKSFLINLSNKSHFLPPSLNYLAGYIAKTLNPDKDKQTTTGTPNR
jgi:DNA-binding Lrp family transcriptional regulator